MTSITPVFTELRRIEDGGLAAGLQVDALGVERRGAQGDVKLVQVSIGDGVTVLTAKTYGWMKIPPGTISRVILVADTTGDLVLDLWRRNLSAGLPASVADTITASDKPQLSSAQVLDKTSFSGWSLNSVDCDYLYFHVDSASSIKQVTVTLYIGVNETVEVVLPAILDDTELHVPAVWTAAVSLPTIGSASAASSPSLVAVITVPFIGPSVLHPPVVWTGVTTPQLGPTSVLYLPAVS